ncbi:MAG: hypothetical protein ACMUJM_14405 [bacterium]
MAMKKEFIKVVLVIFILSIGILLSSPLIHAQEWIGIPPYDALWALWLPGVSTIQATGLPLPIPTGTVPLLPLPTLPAPILPTDVAPLFIAEQAGSWSGTWFSLQKFLAGPMTLNLIEDPSTGTLSGTVSLINNKLLLYPAEVSGAIVPGATFFELRGTFYNFTGGITYSIELWCTLIGDNAMTGNYYIYGLGVAAQNDYGQFNLNLGAPVITPTVTLPIVPITTPVVPVLTAPATATVPVLPPTTAGIAVLPTAAVSALGWF